MIRGRTWKFGDNISTDLMLPGSVVFGTEEEQIKLVFSANRPDWIKQVRRGDIIVGGNNYGTGSSRPAARSLVNLGVACLLAESINGLFFRNCVNFGLPALECPNISQMFEEGQVAEVDLDNFTIRNAETGATLKALPVPDQLLTVMRNGGILPVLEARGLISKPMVKTGAQAGPEMQG